MTTAATPAPAPRRAAATAHRRLLAAVTAALGVAALTACSSPITVGSSAAQGTSTAASAVPVTSLTTIDGNQVSVPGTAATALFFFAVGCGECVGGGKSLAQAQATVATAHGTAAFLAVDMDPSEAPEAITGFLAQVGAQNVPAVIDKDATLSRTYQVSALSTLIVVDSTGTVTYRATDPTADKIAAAIAGTAK
ncbi:hypothetical protein AO501_26740 [Mycobacterium gordonae]|uniref:Thioredoxin domain-containing protein n=1 Tax=Mycobacterium gordonae TaxID=1778 RepID=A0A0Q2LY81_MYCGO|nr:MULTISPECIES: redoxin domain-containing protein [Mycobacterium]KQH80825.1 hypothetical protein AO501_26740 [Mycobacterium gordonae]